MENQLKALFSKVQDGETVLLEKDKNYHVWQNDVFLLEGYYCSNTAKKAENPNGFRSVVMYLKEKKNVIIDGNGATVIIHGVTTPLLFDACDNILLKNLTIDYARPTMSEFAVLSRLGKDAEIQIHEDSLYRVDGNTLIWQGERDENGFPIWENTYKNALTLSMWYDPILERSGFCSYEQGDARPSVPTFEKIEDLGGGKLKVVLKNEEADFKVGRIYQTRKIVRDQLGGFFVNCKNITLQDVKIRFMHGFGLLAQSSENVTYKRVQCTPSKGRTIASNADFFHYSGCKGEIVIEDCVAVGAHDDFVNVHGTYLRIVEINSANKITVRFMHPETWGFENYEKGDEIAFVKWHTLDDFASAFVTDVEKLSDTDFRLTIDRVIPNTIELDKDCVENVTRNPSVTIRNNRFGPSMGRGVLCLTRNTAVIENNLFYKTGSSVLIAENDCNGWFESGRVGKIYLRNNTFVGCAYGLNDSYIVKLGANVKVAPSRKTGKYFIENNHFEECPTGNYKFAFGQIEEIQFKGNVFDKAYKIEKNQAETLIEENNKSCKREKYEEF